MRRLLACVGLIVVVALAGADATLADPVLTLPGSTVVVNVENVTSATVNFTVSAVDGNGDPLTVDCTPSSGSTFNLGTTTVNCSATDALAVTTSGSFSVLVQDTTFPVLSLPGTITVQVVGLVPATVTYSASANDGATAVCSPASGSSFSYGTTSVSCHATDGAGNNTNGSFNVVVHDTVAPTLTLPSDISTTVNGAATKAVSYTASATEGVTPSCSRPSGFAFPLGTTTVSCTATDAAGNSSSGSFNVTVTDPTPPTISVPANISTTVDGSATKVVTFTVTASDGGTSLTPSCSPASGFAFPLGTTTVNCSATDLGGNTASGSFTVTVADTTPPTVSITSAPSGTVTVRTASIGFTTSEGTTSCSLDGGAFGGCSSPAAYSGLADGAHTFTVRAVDAANNTSAPASTTWSVDATPPVLSMPTSAVVVEADSPGGGNAIYTVTASDNGTALLPSTVSCSPRSGAKFPLGDTNVECHAADPYGNSVNGVFKVTVRDTTPPAINAPNASFTATGPQGIRRADADLASYLSRVSATDLVSTPTLTNDVPDVLPIGSTIVTFTATDAAGNKATKRATITVLPVGKAAPPPDLTPPSNPTGIAAKAGDRRVDLSWKTASDVAYVTVTQSVVGDPSPGREVYRGKKTTFTSKSLANGKTYRFVLVAWDRAGNRSKGAVASATPKVELLSSPQQNQRVTTPPLLRWVPSRDTSYYNVQLWRGKQKVLSIWPATTSLQLRTSWTYEHKKQKLLPGTYTWYVWPGIGARGAARYGPLLGSRTFVVVKKAPPL